MNAWAHTQPAVHWHGSGFLDGGLLAKNGPLNVGSKLFADDRAAALLCQALNGGAPLRRHVSTFFAPLTDRARRHQQQTCEFSLPTHHGTGSKDWREFIDHARTVASLHVPCKALLYSSADSIALMANPDSEQEAKQLETLFKGVNQAAFARRHGVPGGASMVNQHIKGRRPINMDSALAYAKGFGLTLAEISPRLAEQMSKALHEMNAPPSALLSRGRPVDVSPEDFVHDDSPDAIASALGLLTQLLADTPPDRRDVIAGLMAGLARDPTNPVYAKTIRGLLEREIDETPMAQKPQVRGMSVFGELDEIREQDEKKRVGGTKA